jgi:hypothetical protein
MNSGITVKKILVLSANSKGTKPLRLGEEIREIKDGLRRARERERFIIESAEAVRYRDICRAILDYEPHIIHFSGHGLEEGLIFEDDTGREKLVEPQALAGLFELFADRVECVLLNACYSEHQAKAIAQHIDYVVGMSQAIGDKAAIEFAIGFYDALLARKNVEIAYKFGRNAIQIASIPEHLTPQLLRKNPSIVKHSLILPSPLDKNKEADQEGNTERVKPSIESKRRFEAAMPEKSKVGQRTEIRVMVVLPDSLGLRAHLPAFTDAGDIIAQKDVIGNDAPLEFPINSATGEPLPINIFIAVTAPDFDIEQATKNISISPKFDSGTITFFLTPRLRQKLGRVIVELFKDEQRTILVSSLTLITEVRGRQDDIVDVVWHIATFTLSFASANHKKIGSIGAIAVLLENELEQTEEVSRKIGEPTVDPQPTQLPNSLGVRKKGVATVSPQPPEPPSPVRVRPTVDPQPPFGLPRIKESSVNPLRSERGINYTRLRDLLKVGKWKEADQETFTVMLKAAGREQERWLDYTSIENFPCINLHTIDQLWVEHSNERFGFSMQKSIWESVGKDYEKFGNAIGWCQEKKNIFNNVEWLNYDNLTFNLDAPFGHLPAAIAPRFQVRGVWTIGWKRQALFSFLMSKLATCNL